MDSREYDLEYFRNAGFRRKQCKSCHKSYWTTGNGEYCGEPPCVDYTFLGNSPMKKRLGVREMREEFLSFTSSKGHTRINRYPIMARWRTDVFFVQASIYNLQRVLGIIIRSYSWGKFLYAEPLALLLRRFGSR